MGLAAAALALAGAASPTPDVANYLAAPPGNDWVESGATSDFLTGTVTPDSYSKWANDNGDSASALRRHGFVTGYGRAWAQKVSRDDLNEFVLEFNAADGATSWYNGLKLFDQTSKYYTKDIPALSIDQSVGVEWTFSDGSHEFAIEFAKGNLFFDITMDADTNNLSATALAQAQTEYDMAPASTQNVASVTGTANVPPLLGLAIIGLIVLVGTVVFALARTSRRRPALATAGFQMSPDGTSWWDGTNWHSASGEIPPGAQRSTDGVYWWDGRTWRPTGVPPG